jgi:hypothetical protein
MDIFVDIFNYLKDKWTFPWTFVDNRGQSWTIVDIGGHWWTYGQFRGHFRGQFRGQAWTSVDNCLVRTMAGTTTVLDR